MRLILLGAPGAGKGTQATVMANKYSIPHISTGDIFRSNIKNGTELGKKAKEFMDKGMLVPDEVTIGIVRDRLAHSDCKNGFILDGFPRTIPQAEYLDEALKRMGISIDYVINIFVPDSEIIARMSGRRSCPDCGSIYHILYNPSKDRKTCDNCNAELIQRADDEEETVINRLKAYHSTTEPLIDYYQDKGKILTIEGQKSIEDTTKDLLQVLNDIFGA